MKNQLSLFEASEMFSDNEKAEEWFIRNRWAHGVRCPRCRSFDVAERASRRPMRFHCRSCRRYFSVRTDTIMAHSRLPLRVWALAMYMLGTHPKGVSSVQMAKVLGVTQSTAWFLCHRIRSAWKVSRRRFAGPVEIDETFVGGSDKFRRFHKKVGKAGAMRDKVIVAGVYDRATRSVYAEVVPSVHKHVMHDFVLDVTRPTTLVYTDESNAYFGLPRMHLTVNHSLGEYGVGDATTNRIESFWSIIKRSFKGTHHSWARKHVHRYAAEIAGRFNMREADTNEKLLAIVRGSVGKRLSYADLTA